jgi:hypothetical protein
LEEAKIKSIWQFIIHKFTIHKPCEEYMKKPTLVKALVLLLGGSFAFASLPVLAHNCKPGTIQFQVRVEQWVKTSSALVTTGADATLSKGASLAKIREEILKKFTELSDNKTEWNITVLNTSPSDSGLEQVHLEAEARLPENQLAALRDKAKELSKPGLTLRVISINFSPSLNELENARNSLRAEIYNNAKEETARLNKVYPTQQYGIYSIIFQPMFDQPMAMMSNAIGGGRALASENRISAEADVEPHLLAVSTKIQMTAVVELSTATAKGATSNSSAP